MQMLIKAIKNQWEACRDVEEAMKKFLNMTKGQLRYSYGCRDEMILIMAAEVLRKEGVTAKNLEDLSFDEIVSGIKDLEETEDIEETERTEK